MTVRLCLNCYSDGIVCLYDLVDGTASDQSVVLWYSGPLDFLRGTQEGERDKEEVVKIHTRGRTERKEEGQEWVGDGEK